MVEVLAGIALHQLVPALLGEGLANAAAAVKLVRQVHLQLGEISRLAGSRVREVGRVLFRGGGGRVRGGGEARPGESSLGGRRGGGRAGAESAVGLDRAERTVRQAADLSAQRVKGEVKALPDENKIAIEDWESVTRVLQTTGAEAPMPRSIPKDQSGAKRAGSKRPPHSPCCTGPAPPPRWTTSTPTCGATRRYKLQYFATTCPFFQIK